MGRLDLEEEQKYGRHMEHVRPETEDVHLLVAFVVGGRVLVGARRQQRPSGVDGPKCAMGAQSVTHTKLGDVIDINIT